MMARLRRFRWLATLLIAVSPAFGGQLLPVLHPCPVDAPWLAAQHAAEHQHMVMAGDDHQMPAQHEAHQHACSCIGACAAPSVAATPEPLVVEVAVLSEPRRAAWPLIEAHDHSIAVVDLLPLSTAPPLA